jgi:hypothetical protein
VRPLYFQVLICGPYLNIPRSFVKGFDQSDRKDCEMTNAKVKVPPKPRTVLSSAPTIAAQDSEPDISLSLDDLSPGISTEASVISDLPLDLPTEPLDELGPSFENDLSLSLDEGFENLEFSPSSSVASGGISAEDLQVEDLPIEVRSQENSKPPNKKINIGNIQVEVPLQTQPLSDDVFSNDVFSMLEKSEELEESLDLPTHQNFNDDEKTKIQGVEKGMGIADNDFSNDSDLQATQIKVIGDGDGDDSDNNDDEVSLSLPSSEDGRGFSEEESLANFSGPEDMQEDFVAQAVAELTAHKTVHLIDTINDKKPVVSMDTKLDERVGKSLKNIATSKETSKEISSEDLRDLALGKDFKTNLSGDESQILKRYAALKERELREREARIEVLLKQITQLSSKLDKSDAERRRLTLGMEELQLEKRNLIDLRDQHQHHLHKVESAHQENLRSMQLRLDNAAYQASRAERKLLEFRERVRNDILKIRLRERELANKLELQKRDAEALLAAKDERLLAQKRDMDRLEFEIENLKDRMIEETRRAEERAAKLSRAVQSLKMAQGMLSGIEEEVLPGTGAKNDGGGEAA